MSITAFNSLELSPGGAVGVPDLRVVRPARRNDTRVIQGLQFTAVIGVFVVILSLLLGLAGAMLLTQIFPRARAAYYTIVTSPILMPGIVIGIATVLFWDRVARLLGASRDSSSIMASS